MSASSTADANTGAEENAQVSQTPTNTYDLLVKNPTDRPGSNPFTIQVEATASVLHLKQLLAASYPGSPEVSAQRLIYAGKLLSDTASMQQVMGTADPSVQHTIHLVVSNINFTTPNASPTTPPRQSQSPQTENTPMNDQPQQHQQFPLLNQPNIFPPYLQFPQYPYMYPGMPPIPPNGPQLYQMPFAPPFPMPPPPSDNIPSAQNPQPSNIPPGFHDMAAYAAHLQQMERFIADTLAAQQNIAQEIANNANAAAERGAQAADEQVRAAQAAAAQAAAAAAALHAQAHARAMGNYDGVGGGQMGNNPQPNQAAAGAPQRHVGIGFAIGRGNAANGAAHPHHHHHHFPNVNQEGGEGGPRVRQFVFQFEINWSLISKLIFVVFLLGQEGTPMRVYSLMILAGIIYLWQTNRLGFVRRIARTAVPNPGQLVDALFPRENQPESDEAADSRQEDTRDAPRQRNRFGRAAVLVSYVYSFVYGFVCSLLPAWRPEPLPRIEELLHPNEGERDVQGENQNENQAGNHEHAD